MLVVVNKTAHRYIVSYYENLMIILLRVYVHIHIIDYYVVGSSGFIYFPNCTDLGGWREKRDILILSNQESKYKRFLYSKISPRSGLTVNAGSPPNGLPWGGSSRGD